MMVKITDHRVSQKPEITMAKEYFLEAPLEQYILQTERRYTQIFEKKKSSILLQLNRKVMVN